MTEEAYLRPPAVLADPGPGYADASRRFQGIPTIERSAAGGFWAAWYGGGVTEDRHNHVLVATAAGPGEAWSHPCLVIDPDGEGPVRAFDPCLWHDPTGRLWLFWAQGYERHTDERSGVWAVTTTQSDSEAPSWSDPVRLCDGIMMNKPIVLSSGEWLLPVARWKQEGSAQVVRSTDRGATWTRLGCANVPAEADRNCDEHMLLERRDGSLWMLVRTGYGIGQSCSRDRGATWSPVAPAPIPHPASRFFIRRIQSDRILLVKHGPMDRRTGRSHLTAFLSEDEGRTWSHGLLLDAREGVSYPDGVEAPDGTIHVIYDRDRRGDKEILVTRFTEDDILQAGPGSADRPPRTVVNKATGPNPGSQART